MQLSPSDTAQAVVVVVEPTATVRMLLTDVLRGLGYTRLHGVSSGKEALSILETEPVNWIIAPLMASEAVNALQILKIITEQADLRHTAVTLLLEPSSEDYCLPLAFELGLLSWQPKSSVKESLLNDFQELLKNITLHKNNLTLTSADYLRRYLTGKGLNKARVELEQNLMACYPGSPKLLVHMAEAEILVGNTNRAWGLLSQAEVLDSRLAAACKQLRDKHSKGGESDASIPRENTLGLTKIVIVDPDNDVVFAASGLLKQLGVNSVQTFGNGRDAIAWLKQSGEEPELIIMEWKLPGLSGPVLVQRIRQSGFVQVPIIVASSLIKREERPLLMEMGVDEIIEKPFDQKSFYSTVVWAIQQNKMPTEQKSLERKLRRLLKANKMEEAGNILAQIARDTKTSEGSKKGLQAEYALAMGDFGAACELGVEALRLGGDSLSLLSMVGKALLKLNQYEKALKCFEKANTLCSINIERLLTIAEINIQLDNKVESAKAMDQVSSLDPDNDLVQEVRCKIDLDIGNLDAAAKGMDKLESVPRIASYINNRAVALARSGRYEDGVQLYKNVIQCLGEKWSDLSSSVSYNLGLAYARSGDYELSIDTLESLAKNSNVPVHKKARALLKRVEASVKSGDKLFKDAEDADQASKAGTIEDGSMKFSP